MGGEAAVDLALSMAIDGIVEVRQLAQAGETNLATIQAIRLLHSFADERPSAAFSEVQAAILSDLGALRSAVGDLDGAVGCLRTATAFGPSDPLVRQNLDDAEAALAERDAAPRSLAGVELSVDNLHEWVVRALEGACKFVGLKDKDVIEIGGTVPIQGVRATGAQRWVACDLHAKSTTVEGFYQTHPANAERLPVPDASFDVAFSCCAFEHFGRLDRVLAEIARVLRPGGVLFAQYSPIWSYHNGHHLVLDPNTDDPISFNDPIVPPWGHLLLTEPEMERFLTFGLDAERARRASQFIYRADNINRLFEADYRALFAASALHPVRVDPWGGVCKPKPAMREALVRAHPRGGRFALAGLRAILIKRD